MDTWISDFLRLCAHLALVFVPGMLAARLLGIRGLLCAALGPVFVGASVGVGAIAANLVGIAWTALAFAATLLFLPLIAALVGRAAGARAPLGLFSHPSVPRGEHVTAPIPLTLPVPHGSPLTPGLALVIPASWAATIVPVMARSAPTVPIQQYDPVFHMNALWSINHTGNASSFGGLTPLFGLDTTPTTVPAGWHGLLAPLSTPTTIVATVNTFSLVVPLVWIVAIAAMAGVLLPGRTSAPVLAAGLAPLLIEFPTYMLTKYPAWPNAWAMALLPAFIAWSVALVVAAQKVRGEDRRRFVAVWLPLWGLTLVGLCIIHPLAGLSLVVLGALPLIWVMMTRWRRLARGGQGERAWQESVVILAFVLVSLVALVAIPGLAAKLSSMSDAYASIPNIDWNNPLKAFVLWPIVDEHAPSVIGYLTWGISLIIGVLTVMGIAWCTRSRAGVYVLWAFMGAWLLTVTTLMRSGPLVSIAGLWYMSTHRAMAVQAIVQVVILAQGLRALGLVLGIDGRDRPGQGDHGPVLGGREMGEWLGFGPLGGRSSSGEREELVETVCVGSRPRRRLSIALPTVVALVAASFSGVAASPIRSDLAWRVYSPTSPFVSVMLDPGALRLARDVHRWVPEGATVLGDPVNGSAYVQAVGNRQVVFPQLYFRSSNADENYLRAHFSKLASDPQVCQILRRHNIRYAWLDDDRFHAGADQSWISPGLYGVDVSEGFEILARAESVTLVRITACDVR